MSLLNRGNHLKKQQDTDVNEAQAKHSFKISVLSTGLAAIRQVAIYPPIAPFSFALFIYTAMPYIQQVEKSLKARKIDGYVLFFMADALTLGIGQYFAAALGVLLIHFGRYTVEKAKEQSQNMLITVFEQQSRNVWILKDNIEIEIPLEEIKFNDIIVINTGEVIPVDGLITDGMAMIDQHTLTGESQPAEKGLGEPVFASTIALSGRILIQVEKSGQDTKIAKIGEILTHAIDFKSSLQLKGEEWANQMTLPLLGIAGATLVLMGPVSAIVLVNAHIANRIRVFASLGTLNYLNVASHNGILVKDGRVLESLIKVDTVLFDKTGTLTSAEPEIKRIIVCHHYQENELLAYAAAAERKLTHPIAKAILNKANDLKLTLPEIEDSKYQIGYGITVNIEDKIIRVGSLRFMKMEGIAIPKKIEEAVEQAHTQSHSLVMVAINDRVSGAIEMQPSIRPEIKEIISGLRQRGIKHIGIVSGDLMQPTQSLAEELGMDSYYYEILPENKAEIVEQLQTEGKSVCFVGDGINDAIAMKKAQVSVSLRGATSLATDLAQVILMDGSLSHLCTLFDISKDLEANLQKSLKISLVPTVTNMAGAFVLNFGIVTAFVVSHTIFLFGLNNAMQPLKQIPNEKSEKDTQPDNLRQQQRLEVALWK